MEKAMLKEADQIFRASNCPWNRGTLHTKAKNIDLYGYGVVSLPILKEIEKGEQNNIKAFYVIWGWQRIQAEKRFIPDRRVRSARLQSSI